MSTDSALVVTEAEAESIKKSFGRKVSEIAEDVTAIRDWVKKQPHLPQNEDEQILRRLLNLNKYSVERTKQKLDYYYTSKNLVPEILGNCYPLHPIIQKVNSYGGFVPMPKLTPDFDRVSMSHLFMENPPDFNGLEFMKLIIAQFEFRLKFDNYIHDVLIIDFKGYSIANTLTVRPADVTKLIKLVQQAYSERIKGIHCLHTPTYASTLVNLAKYLMTNKMGNRIYVHSTLESLYEYVPRDILPKDFGGNEPPYADLHKKWIGFMENENDWMVKRCAMKSNEKLRIGKPLDIEEFGTEGTFRKINID